MYSSECKLQNTHPDLLYDKYALKLIITGIYNGKIIYIDTVRRMVYYSSGQAVLEFRH